MPTLLPDEHSLRERVDRLRSIYDRARQRLSAMSADAAKGKAPIPSAADISNILGEINGADAMLRQLVDAWSRSPSAMRRNLAVDVEELRQSAASCLALVSTAEREFGQRRERVVGQMDEGVTRNRAVRAYSHAMRQ